MRPASEIKFFYVFLLFVLDGFIKIFYFQLNET